MRDWSARLWSVTGSISRCTSSPCLERSGCVSSWPTVGGLTYYAKPMLMLEFEMWILFREQFPDSEIPYIRVVQQHDGAVRTFRLPLLKIYADTILSMITIDMQ